MKRILAIISILGFLGALMGQNKYEPVTGYWEGHLKISSKDSLAVGVYIEKAQDSVKVVMDSPDQYVTGIPVSGFIFRNDSVFLDQSADHVKYIALLDREKEVLSGTFTQHGKVFPLILNKTENRKIIRRPQTPRPPFNYNIDSTIALRDPRTGQPVIMGTLTYPREQPPKATLIIISGSGWQDRNGTIFGHKGYWVIADYLTNQGYAVFRYDDLPPKLIRNLSTLDYPYYVNIIVDYLKPNPHTADSPVGIIGHSEGGLVAFMTAAEYRNIDFIISMAGMAQNFKDVIQYQIRLISESSGEFTDEEIKKIMDMYENMYSILEKEKDVKKASVKLGNYFDNFSQELTEEEKIKFNLTPANILSTKQYLLTPWIFQISKIKPEKYIRKVKCPVYALNGSKDTQVDYKSNLRIIEDNLKPNKLNRFEMIEGVNHLFQDAGSGLVEEYGELEQTISPEVLAKLKNWLDMVTD